MRFRRHTERCLVHGHQSSLLRWNTKSQTQAYRPRCTEAQCNCSQWSCALWLFHPEQVKNKQRGDSATRETWAPPFLRGPWRYTRGLILLEGSNNGSCLASAPGGSSLCGFKMGLMDHGMKDKGHCLSLDSNRTVLVRVLISVKGHHDYGNS